MAKRRTFQRQHRVPRGAAPPRPAPIVYERKPPTIYGKPIIVLEDLEKNTFEFKAGAWVPHALTIAQCRETCKVKELPQKVNSKTRYEVCYPMQ